MNPKIIFSEAAIDKKQTTPVSVPVLTLVKKYQESLRPPTVSEESKIHVDEIASKVAKFYEKIRKIVDWKEENLLRRNAIERILKRSLFGEFSKLNFIFKNNINSIAESLVLELIRGGHLPNDEISQGKIDEVQNVLNKYVYLIKNAFSNTTASVFKFKEKVNFYEWILAIASCEIEEVLSAQIKENALIESMTELMTERIKIIPPELITEEEKILQVYIAVHRTLFDLDDPIIAYRILKYKYHYWLNPSQKQIEEINANIFFIWDYSQKELHHPLAKDFFNLCERTDAIFTLIGDILDSYQKEPEKLPAVISDKQNLKVLVTKAYNNRIASLKKRLFKLAVFSSLSVFVANWFTFFVVEVPIAHLFYQGFNLLAASVDFLLPTTVMFLLVSLIKPPPASNLNKVIELTNQFVYTDQGKELFEIKLKKKKKPLTVFIISLIYLSVCLGTFYLIAKVFFLAKIPLSSVILDTIGIALNVFAALIVRNKARELTVEDKSTFWEFLLDIISLPIAEIGSWIASKWKEYNIVSIFFNVIIETPFISFLDFIENWRQFLKERKADIH